MTTARHIAEGYFYARYRGDRAEARRHLADDLLFFGPVATLSGADHYLRATEHAVRMVKRADIDKVFADGADACIFYRLHLSHPPGAIVAADWYHLRGDTIAAIRTILDTAPFLPESASSRSRSLELRLNPGQCGRPAARRRRAARSSAPPSRTWHRRPRW
jgi:hypothetical protein